jgi:hypothetical protein
MAGYHAVELNVDGTTERKKTVVAGFAVVEVTQSPPPARPPAAEAAPSGVSPGWFWLAGGITVAAGAGTVVSAIDASNKHSAFTANPTPATRDAGVSSEVRTNVLIVATVAAAAVTATVGIFAVRWVTSPTQVALIAGASF